MSDETQPEAVDKTAETVAPSKEEVITKEEVRTIEKDIEVKDALKIEGVKSDIEKAFKEQLSEIRTEIQDTYNQQLQTKLEEQQKAFEARFTSMTEQVEELKGRKGVVPTSNDTPYEEIQKETAQDTSSEAPKFSVDALKNLSGRDDLEAADAFLQNLQK